MSRDFRVIHTQKAAFRAAFLVGLRHFQSSIAKSCKTAAENPESTLFLEKELIHAYTYSWVSR